jgi:NhaP-type Na+/H+ or K+/H+ antiporter
MTWKQIEATVPHLTYLFLATFLIFYALFSSFIRNRLHLSEPPLATLIGIIFGPSGLKVIEPGKWGFEDGLTQEIARVVAGIQVFVVGVELPKAYFARHWKSVAIMLGPVMAIGWVVTALLVHLLLKTDVTTALIISACLTPTDPVLAASVLANSRFSGRVPRRIKNMLSAESACNDGVSFPFLYAGIFPVIAATTGSAVKEWFLITILWQCAVGLSLGVIIGQLSNRVLRFSHHRGYIDSSSFIAFYLLLAIFSIGVGSTLGLDDFLVSFGAGIGFAWDGWFAKQTKRAHLANIVDLLLNSSIFVYFGATIPWSQFNPSEPVPLMTPWRLTILLVLILLFRRIPIVLALKGLIPDIKTYREALFSGHFGPMGVGALFLAIEARAQLETQTSIPTPHPPAHSPYKVAIETIRPVISFVVLGSVMVHGLSVAIISVGSHYSRKVGERAPLIGAETEGLDGMIQDGAGGESEPSVSGESDLDY